MSCHEGGVVGASGYLGAELLRLLASHPDLEVVAAQAETSAGTAIAELFPSLGGPYAGLVDDADRPGGARGL